jgi:hypothetical protein
MQCIFSDHSLFPFAHPVHSVFYFCSLCGFSTSQIWWICGVFTSQIQTCRFFTCVICIPVSFLHISYEDLRVFLHVWYVYLWVFYMYYMKTCGFFTCIICRPEGFFTCIICRPEGFLHLKYRPVGFLHVWYVYLWVFYICDLQRLCG